MYMHEKTHTAPPNRSTHKHRHSVCCGSRESHCVATDKCQRTHSTAQRCWNRRPKSIRSTPVCGQIRPMVLRAPTTHLRVWRITDTECVKVILPWQLVDTNNRQTNTHYTRQTYMCELKRRQEAMVKSQQQNTQNERHGIVSTVLTGCSKRTHPANTVGDAAPLWTTQWDRTLTMENTPMSRHASIFRSTTGYVLRLPTVKRSLSL